jgi:recombination protein RecR
MGTSPTALATLVEQLVHLPGIGPKTAQRLALHLLAGPPGETAAIADALRALHGAVQTCQQCFHLGDGPLCHICADPRRDASILCVVAQPESVLTIERTGTYRGLYHVLGGTVSPLEGRRLDELHAVELVRRVEAGTIREILLALSPTPEGSMTTAYLLRLLDTYPVVVSTIAVGIPVGGALEHADEATVTGALSGREVLQSA